ncbi:FxLYD domain-containing protein [Lactococcus fujiensis]|uniref:Secreted protein n=1 Tax=Lactococcus fujiensis JCM 16395 TaxID=1291764 RepID=A0A2A5RIS2_9LACT|nr:FxLYD domain-containing protein [Lactococcus fujiensis]PCR98995.1 hypothetical protein RT41_GL000565 [Lactococcus fujiensis JCM 16395]
MKKITTLLIGFVMLLLVLTSCGTSKTSTGQKNNYADKSFISDLSAGLQERWKLGDELDKISNPSTSQTKDYYSKFVKVEMDSVGSYKDKKFKDTKLQSLALQYINLLEDSKKEITGLGTYDGMTKWEDTYQSRTKLLVEFKNNYNLAVDDKYKTYLDGLEADGQKAIKNDELKTKITTLVNGIVFVYKQEEYDDTYKKYQAVVENNTGTDLSSFSGQVNLVDANGVTVDNTFISTDNWKNGSKVLFEFTTDKTFSKTVITPQYSVAD